MIIDYIKYFFIINFYNFPIVIFAFTILNYCLSN